MRHTLQQFRLFNGVNVCVCVATCMNGNTSMNVCVCMCMRHRGGGGCGGCVSHVHEYLPRLHACPLEAGACRRMRLGVLRGWRGGGGLDDIHEMIL